MQSKKVGKPISIRKIISYGVPQGSILGLFLFLCFVNDLPSHLLHAQSFLYADDTALVVRGNDPDFIENQLNSVLSNVANWFDANKLSVIIYVRPNVCIFAIAVTFGRIEI